MTIAAVQPKANTQMKLNSPPTGDASNQQDSDECQHGEPALAKRLRGGGGGKDCFMGIVECFLCFECCKVCCDCFAEIVCCPCEMCC